MLLIMRRYRATGNTCRCRFELAWRKRPKCKVNGVWVWCIRVENGGGVKRRKVYEEEALLELFPSLRNALSSYYLSLFFYARHCIPVICSCRDINRPRCSRRLFDCSVETKHKKLRRSRSDEKWNSLGPRGCTDS